MTDDCVYEVKSTGERLGRVGRRPLALLGLPRCLLRDAVGAADGRDRPAGNPRRGGYDDHPGSSIRGVDQVGDQVHLEWVIYFPWNPDQKKFEGETIYSIRPLQP